MKNCKLKITCQVKNYKLKTTCQVKNYKLKTTCQVLTASRRLAAGGNAAQS